MKIKALGFGIVLFAFSSCTLAYNVKGDYYVAADAGIIQADFNNNYRDQTDSIPQNITEQAVQHGYLVGLAFGYRQLFQQDYFLGGEISGNIDGNNALFQSGANSTAFSDQLQLKYHVDLTFKPGAWITNTFGSYLKFGLSYAIVQDKLVSPVGNTAISTAYNQQENLVGITAGLGFEKHITQHYSIFTEINYHDYGSVNFQNFQNFSATYSHYSHVYSYDGKVGLAYTF